MPNQAWRRGLAGMLTLAGCVAVQVQAARTAGPFSGFCAKLAFLGAQAGGAAFERSMPVMLLLSLVLPHRLRVSLSPNPHRLQGRSPSLHQLWTSPNPKTTACNRGPCSGRPCTLPEGFCNK